ncbi:MAG: cytochrome P450 [Myxococcales bacterium]|nr:cytochrome P450 [Myxococcales bacterium]
MLPPGPETPAPLLLLRWVRDPFSTMASLRATWGETFTVNLGVMPRMVMLSNPEHIREVFANQGDDLHAGKLATMLGPFLGARSLILLDGPEHRRMRKLLLPPFHGERMEVYGARMLEITAQSLAGWPVGRPFPVHEPMQAITLEIILQTVFGIEDPTLRGALSRSLTRVMNVATSPALLFPSFQRDFGPWSPWGRYQALAVEADTQMRALIAQRRGELGSGRNDVLTMMLEARDDEGRGLSDDDLRDELVTLLVAGHETTATALSWAMHCLLENPRAAQVLQSELDAASRAGLTPASIARLEYLDAVVRETLRLQPIIPVVGRVLQRPMTLAGWELPAGVAVTPSVYLAHRRESTFERPEAFEPERFLKKKYAPSEWFPFGGGNRRCIGMAFAMYEMKMVLATVLTRVRLSRGTSRAVGRVRRSITIAPAKGMPVIVAPRDPHRVVTG